MNTIAPPVRGPHASAEDPAADCGEVSVTDSLPGRRDEKRATLAAAGWLAALSAASPGSVVAGITTVTTTQQYGPTPLSYDVLFTPVESATDLVSISAGSVYTGEAGFLTIKAIASDDTLVNLFPQTSLNPWFSTVSLSSVTNNTFTDFAAHDIKGLRFTLSNASGLQPSLTLPLGTEFVIATVPEPGAGVLLACSLAAVLVSRGFTRFVPTRRTR